MEPNLGLFLLHLLKFPGRYQSEMMRRLTGRGYTDLRLSYGPVIMALARESLRLTDLAGRLDMQKQNCTQLVRRIEEAGYIERRADTSDRRSRLLALTARGETLVRDGVAVIRELDAQLSAVIGERAYADFAAAVHRLYIGVVAQGEGAAGDPVPGALINEVIQLARYTSAQLNALVRARGHAEIRPAHEQVLLHLGEGRVRIPDIARENDVSRQAISAIVNELRTLGYISLDVDPEDARGRIIRLTARGDILVEHSAEAAQGLLAQYIGVLGNARFARLAASLRSLYAQLNAATPPADPAPDPDASLPVDLARYILARLGAGEVDGKMLAALASGTGEPSDLRARLEAHVGERELADLERVLARMKMN